MSVGPLQAQGRQACKKGEYAQAVQLFDRALGRQPSVQLYDDRASANEKRWQLQEALRDAKNAIRLGPADATGYLRAGQVLTKMAKAGVAMEIYALGLRNVRAVGRGHGRLQRRHDALQARLCPRHGVDPLAMLPRELATAVLECLSFRQRVAVSRVSKAWQSFIRSEPRLWQDLDLSDARAGVATRFISTAINAGKRRITAATLNRLFDFDKVLRALVKHCPIERLTLAETGLQTRELVDALEMASKLKELRILPGTDVCPTLLREAMSHCTSTLHAIQWSGVENFDFDGWETMGLPMLKSLEIGAGELRDRHSCCTNFFARMPRLEQIRLSSADVRPMLPPVAIVLDFRANTQLQRVEIRMSWVGAGQLLLPPAVRELRVWGGRSPCCGFWPGSSFLPPDSPHPLRLADLPNLEHFHLGVPTTELTHVLSQLAAPHPHPHPRPRSSQLRSLSLAQPELDPTAEISLLTARTAHLEHLALTDCYLLDDARIVRLVQDFQHLRSLDLSGTQITGAGVKDIVALGRVDALILNDCHFLGRDAVDWARRQGVRVESRVPRIVSGGGKKVRY